jgi:hypothetical protein
LRAARRSSACVLITIGPCLAMGSLKRLPETSRNQIPSRGLNCHLIATVEENEQAVAVALANREIASCDGLIN